MTAYLPEAAERHIDPASTFISLRNLTSAAESGEIALSAVTTYIRAVERSERIAFSRTRPIPLVMKEAIERHPDLTPMQVVYKGWKEGLWDYGDVEAFETNQAVLCERRSRAPKRGVYLTRNRRTITRRPATEGMFVPKMSLDALCSYDVCDGAKVCLALLLSIAGKEDVVVTYTSSIATRLGRTTRSVRNYFMALEDAGLIARSPGKAQNTVRIMISAECRPEPYREPDHVRAYKLAGRSRNVALQLMAVSVASAAMQAFPSEFPIDGRRKEISSFNPKSILFPSDVSGSERYAADRPKARGVTTHSDLERDRPFGTRQGHGSQERVRSYLPSGYGRKSHGYPGSLSYSNLRPNLTGTFDRE